MSTPCFKQAMNHALLDRTRVSAAAKALGDDAVLILDMKRCPHSPRLLQELEVIMTLQPSGRALRDDDEEDGRRVPRTTTLYWMDISDVPLDSESTWLPGVPVLVTMSGVALGIQAAADAKRMVDTGAALRRSPIG